jgi:hypothetical protein
MNEIIITPKFYGMTFQPDGRNFVIAVFPWNRWEDVPKFEEIDYCFNWCCMAQENPRLLCGLKLPTLKAEIFLNFYSELAVKMVLSGCPIVFTDYVNLETKELCHGVLVENTCLDGLKDMLEVCHLFQTVSSVFPKMKANN